MDGEKLTPAQANRLYQSLWPALNYLIRLRTRMEKVGFPQDYTLYLLVCRTYDSMHRLMVDLHYRSCGHGVGRSERDTRPWD